VQLGYFLSCEEYSPEELIAQARAAERAGFTSLWISDHYHPWNDAQGHSAFVWSVIGALSQVCSLPVTTAVTCPTIRIHPAVIAQAAATSARMLPGGLILGVGSGEALNEHILGDAWPTADMRLDMLEEAVRIIRRLWSGEVVSHEGRHYRVDTARVYTRPDEPPHIYVSGLGPKAADLAARIGDGYIGTAPDAELVGGFKSASGGKPAQGGAKVAFAKTRREGVEHAHRLWSTSGLPGELAQVLPSPRHFEQAAQLVTEEMTADAVVAGSDVEEHIEQIRSYAAAGYDALHVANMGPHHQEMIAFYGEEIIPRMPQVRRRHDLS
jgi:G6PDH family F420-dependent oxidoreductase